jgi:hypothetical protein
MCRSPNDLSDKLCRITLSLALDDEYGIVVTIEPPIK